jgi:UDP-N-acetylglucosamine--N-acetylmuramyl-(pentapeptide) pyrophosphoryl-undecaprenol N-acetylglucosamine transferase
VAGGGTGGHLFPGITIAEEFISRHQQNRVLFVSTGNQFEQNTLAQLGYPLKTISVAGLKGQGLWKKFKSLSIVPVGVWQSMAILKSFKPDLVLGVGSYAAGPMVLAAWLKRIPVVLHEQNILPGITNRVLSRFARRIYVSFENTSGGFAPDKVQVTGNPVRKEILLAAGEDPPDQISAPSLEPPMRLFILGGSQGAHAINMAMIDALPSIKEKKRLRIIHQTGTADESQVKTAYASHGIEAVVKSFFQDMDRQYHSADLIICRAGATTVAEITAIGKAALFIPFPFAADDHQKLNAEALTSRGAAEMIEEKDLTAVKLADRINHYAQRPDSLARMSGEAKRLGKPEAAHRIVEDCYQLIGSRAGQIER